MSDIASEYNGMRRQIGEAIEQFSSIHLMLLSSLTGVSLNKVKFSVHSGVW